MKTILIAGNNAVTSIENYYSKYLIELGYRVDIFQLNKYYEWSTFFKIRYKLGDNSVFENLNIELIRYCTEMKPDIVWVFKGFEIFPETILKLKNLDIFLVNYNPDHPFIRTSVMHGGKNIPEAVPIYDLHFAYSKSLVEKLRSEYSKECVRLPFGYELDNDTFRMCKSESEIERLCFIGTPDLVRTKLLVEIAKKGFEIDVYSLTYPFEKFLRSVKGIRLFPVITGQEFWKNVRRYRIQLNFLREHNIGSHNQRTFEVPAMGGVLLSEYSKEQSDFFIENNEVFFFRNEIDMVDKISFLLKLNSREIGDIRKNAREASLNNRYSYKERAEIVFREFDKI
jgi:spore maturation protein CgeB